MYYGELTGLSLIIMWMWSGASVEHTPSVRSYTQTQDGIFLETLISLLSDNGLLVKMMFLTFSSLSSVWIMFKLKWIKHGLNVD